jgi:glycosyltransferase involved in cell wall biosynthesis
MELALESREGRMSANSRSVAILVPTYNSRATIADTLRSLLEQSRMDLLSAVYLADDASSDDTIDIAIRTWTNSDIPLRVLRADRNGGERRNVNRAMKEIADATEWVLILHSDDIAKPHWLDQIYLAIEEANEAVASICSSYDVFFLDGSIDPGEEKPGRSVEYILGTPEAIRSTLLRGCWWHISGCAIRTAAFFQIGSFVEDLPQMGDWEWLLRCLRSRRAVLYIPRTLILYRQHYFSVSSASFRVHRDVRESFRIIRDHAGFLSVLDILTLYRQRFVTLAQRAGISLVRRQFNRAGTAFALMAAAPWIALQTVAARRQR